MAFALTFSVPDFEPEYGATPLFFALFSWDPHPTQTPWPLDAVCPRDALVQLDPMKGLSADFRDPTPTGGAGYDFFFFFSIIFSVSFRIGRDLFLFLIIFSLLGVQSGLVGFHFILAYLLFGYL